MSLQKVFSLRGTNSREVLDELRNGEFDEMPKCLKKILRAEIGEKSLLATKRGTSYEDGTFIIKDSNNSNIVIAFTGQENYEIRSNDKKFSKRKICRFCHNEFKGDPKGYIVKYEIVDQIVDGVYEKKYLFWEMGDFCSRKHAYNAIKRTRRSNWRLYSTLTASVIKLEDKKNEGREKNIGLSDPELLLENGGSVSRNEFEDPRFCWENIGVYFFPAKEAYAKIEIK